MLTKPPTSFGTLFSFFPVLTLPSWCFSFAPRNPKWFTQSGQWFFRSKPWMAHSCWHQLTNFRCRKPKSMTPRYPKYPHGIIIIMGGSHQAFLAWGESRSPCLHAFLLAGCTSWAVPWPSWPFNRSLATSTGLVFIPWPQRHMGSGRYMVISWQSHGCLRGLTAM